MASLCSSSSALARSVSPRATVKLISLLLSRPMDWRMMSTLIRFFAKREKILKAIPGSSAKPTKASRATFLSFATPLTWDFSMFFTTSLTFVPGFPVKLERTSRLTLYRLAISTERLCSTCAPRLASSSISS